MNLQEFALDSRWKRKKNEVSNENNKKDRFAHLCINSRFILFWGSGNSKPQNTCKDNTGSKRNVQSYYIGIIPQPMVDGNFLEKKTQEKKKWAQNQTTKTSGNNVHETGITDVT